MNEEGMERPITLTEAEAAWNSAEFNARRAEAAEAKVAALEHSNRVLTEALDRMRAERADAWTPWDRFAAAALSGFIALDGVANPQRDTGVVAEYADAMMERRAKRNAPESDGNDP